MPKLIKKSWTVSKPNLAAAINSTILVQGNYILLVPGEISLHHSSASYDSAYIHSTVKSFPSGTMSTYSLINMRQL